MTNNVLVDPARPQFTPVTAEIPSQSVIDRIPEEILQLDLSPVATRLRNKYGWTESDIERVELEYRMFLTIVQENLGTHDQLVPTPIVDAYWHLHILFSRLYSRQCHQLFDRYLHHEPTDGTKENRDELEEQGICDYLGTGDLYEKRFGYRPPEYHPEEYARVGSGPGKCWCSGAPVN